MIVHILGLHIALYIYVCILSIYDSPIGEMISSRGRYLYLTVIIFVVNVISVQSYHGYDNVV